MDTARYVELGFQLDERITQKQLDTVQALSLAELTEMAAGRRTVPKILEGATGLLEVELLNRNAAVANLSATQLSNLQSRRQLVAGAREDFLNQFNTAGELRTLLNKSKTEPSILPTGVTSGHIQDEINRRETARLSIRGAEIANEKGEFELVDLAKGQLLPTLSRQDIQQTLDVH